MCLPVPTHMKHLDWQALALPGRLTECLVKVEHDPGYVKVLSAFEPAEFIHVIAPALPPSDSPQQENAPPQTPAWLRFDLPRYGLSFSLDHTGRLASRDQKGLLLTCCQQLVDEEWCFPGRMLSGFCKYLLLEMTAQRSRSWCCLCLRGG